MTQLENSKKQILVKVLLLAAVLLMQSCSNSTARFAKNNPSSDSPNISQSTESQGNLEPTVSDPSTPLRVPPPAPYVEPPVVEKRPLSIEGWASGVASTTNPDQWESWAPRGTSIQLHYSLAGQDSLTTALQIVKAGSVVKLGEAVDPSALATDEQGKPYAYAQYFNLATIQGAYTFNIPLRVKTSATALEQVLKVGKYSIYLTACGNTKLSSCQMSQVINFEVR